MMNIGEISKRTGIAVSAIRYYEEAGLLPSPMRLSNNRRVFDRDAMAALNFINSCRSAGLSLNQIKLLQSELRASPEGCGVARTVLVEAVADLDAKIKELRFARQRLSQVLDACSVAACDEAGHCTIATNLM